MREAVKECEESGGDRAIPPEHIDEDGEIDEAHIFCGHCHDPESYEVRSAFFLWRVFARGMI